MHEVRQQIKVSFSPCLYKDVQGHGGKGSTNFSPLNLMDVSGQISGSKGNDVISCSLVHYHQCFRGI
jgi:hypothetical protein